MSTADGNPDREPESRATEAPAATAETPSRLQQAAEGVAEAQAWKGEQITKGWRKLVKALGRHKDG